MHKQKITFWIGIFLIIVGLISVTVHTQLGSVSLLLWYCNHMTLLGAILILIGSRYWLNAVINVGFVPVLFWIIDYVFRFAFNYRLFGVVDYVFAEQNKVMFILFHQHIIVIPLLIAALYYLGGAVKNAWKGSLIYGLILFLVSIPFKAENMNCMHKVCVPFLPDNAVFLVLQYLFLIAAVFFTNWLLMKYLPKKH